MMMAVVVLAFAPVKLDHCRCSRPFTAMQSSQGLCPSLRAFCRNALVTGRESARSQACEMPTSMQPGLLCGECEMKDERSGEGADYSLVFCRSRRLCWTMELEIGVSRTRRSTQWEQALALSVPAQEDRLSKHSQRLSTKIGSIPPGSAVPLT
jgi:hypothetical protein